MLMEKTVASPDPLLKASRHCLLMVEMNDDVANLLRPGLVW